MKAKGVIAVLVGVGLLVFVAVSVLGGSKDKAATTRTEPSEGEVHSGVEHLDKSPLDTEEGGVSGQINYQGYLVNSSDSSAVTDVLEMIFELYDVETGGSPLWSETHESVAVRNGFFTVPLGSINPIPEHVLNGRNLWLQRIINGEELHPRNGWLEPKDIWDFDVSNIRREYIACWLHSGDDCYFTGTGNIGIGTTEPEYKLDVMGDARFYNSVVVGTGNSLGLEGRIIGHGYGVIPNGEEAVHGVIGIMHCIGGYVCGYGVLGIVDGSKGMGVGGKGPTGVYGEATPEDLVPYTSYGVYGKAADVSPPNVSYGVYSEGDAKVDGKLHINDVMRLQPRATAPSDPQVGDMYVDSSDDNKLKVYDGITWQACW